MNYSGLWYRIIAVCLLGIMICSLNLIIEVKRTSKKKSRIVIFSAIIALFIGMALVYLIQIECGESVMCIGQLVSVHRDSRVAPPLPLTSEYVFQSAGKKISLYLDSISQKKYTHVGLSRGHTISFTTIN